MRLSFQGFSKGAHVTFLCCVFVLLTSCRFARLDPFRTDAHLLVTDANSAMTLVNHRARPASTYTGKPYLTREDCRALALANNLELQAARLEELTRKAIEYSNQKRILPHFLFSGDLSEKSALRFSYSDVLGKEGLPPNIGGGGTGVTSFSTGHERSTWYYVLETRWSPTDAALAYYVTKSSVNDTGKAHYQKVRAAQKLIEIVDSACSRLIANQESLSLAENLLSLRNGAKRKMGELLEGRLVRTEDYQRAEQKATRARRLLSKVRNDMEADRNILASVMALSPDYTSGGGFQVVGTLSRPFFDTPIQEMEMLAVRRRPEAYDSGLTHLSSVNDLRRTIVKYFPRVTGFWRHARDKDKFLYDKDWKEVGVSIYFDLIEWLANVDEARASRLKAEKTQREMAAVALGITSQVRTAAIKYADGMDELEAAETTLDGSRRVLHSVEVRGSMQDVDRLAIEESRGDVLEAKISRIHALGEANANLAVLQSSMGTNYNEPMSQ